MQTEIKLKNWKQILFQLVARETFVIFIYLNL